MNAQRFFYNNTGVSHPTAPDVSYPANNEHVGSSAIVKRSLEDSSAAPSKKRVKTKSSVSLDVTDDILDSAPNEGEGLFDDFSSFSVSLENFDAYNHVHYYAGAASLFDNDGEEFRDPFLTPNPYSTNKYLALISPRSKNPFQENDTVSGVSPVKEKSFRDTEVAPICTEGGGESPIFCPVPRRDSKWLFSMDDSDDEEDEKDDEIVQPVSFPGFDDSNSGWILTMDDSDDEKDEIDDKKNGRDKDAADKMVHPALLPGLSDDQGASPFSVSDYSKCMRHQPASPPKTDQNTWSPEGNPFEEGESIDNLLFNAAFSDMDVEGLIDDPGFELEDHDHLRYPAEDAAGLPTPLLQLQPHVPFKECGCQWCESYRLGENFEPHDPMDWCSCVPCIRFRANQHAAEVREKLIEEERRWNLQMHRIYADSREAVKEEETRFIDLMDFVPDEDEQRETRASLFRTLKDKIRHRNI